MQSNTPTQTQEGLSDEYYKRLQLIFQEIGKRVPDMDATERSQYVEEQIYNTRNVANLGRKDLVPIEPIFKKQAESLEPFYLIMARIILEEVKDTTDNDLKLLVSYIIDLKEHKTLIDDNNLVELASKIYQKIEKRLLRDSRYKKTDAMYGLESELDNLGDLNNETQWISAIDNLQNLGFKVMFDAARELPLPKSESPIAQLRALLELKKLNIILPSDHFSLHVNVGGIEDPQSILEDVFLLNSMIKFMGSALLGHTLDLNEDSSFQMDSNGKKPLIQGLGFAYGFNLVFRETDVVEFRDLISDVEFTFKDVSKILLTFSILVDLVKAYSRVKKGRGTEKDIMMSEKWIKVKNEFLTKLATFSIDREVYNLPAHLEALTSSIGYFKDSIKSFLSSKLTEDEVKLKHPEIVEEQKNRIIDQVKRNILFKIINESDVHNHLDRKDQVRFFEFTNSRLNNAEFIYNESDSQNFKDFIAIFEAKFNEKWIEMEKTVNTKAEEEAPDNAISFIISEKNKEFREANKERIKELERLANLDPSFVRYKNSPNNKLTKDIDILEIFYKHSETLNYVDAQVMRLSFGEMSEASRNFYQLVLQSK